MVPRTEWGKIGVIIYACIGIPVYILYFTNMGKVFSRTLKWIYTKAYRFVEQVAGGRLLTNLPR
jgi:hypothetical protein